MTGMLSHTHCAVGWVTRYHQRRKKDWCLVAQKWWTGGSWMTTLW